MPGAAVCDGEQCRNTFWLAPFISGAVSGIAGAIVGQPLDTVKVRLQTGFKMPCGSIPNSAFKCLMLTVRYEGAPALFKGLTPQIYSQLVATSFLFGVQDKILESASAATGRPSDNLALICASGAVSGGLLAGLTCPIELVKCGIQAATETTPKNSLAPKMSPASSVAMMMSVAKKVSHHHGVSALYTGLCLTSLRCAVGNAAFFGVYECCWRLDGDVPPSQRTGLKSAVYGAVAGSSYWISCYPLDCWKSQIQCETVASCYPQSQVSTAPNVANQLRSRCILQTAKEMYRGLTVTLVRGIPVSSVAWLVFGVCSERINNIFAAQAAS